MRYHHPPLASFSSLIQVSRRHIAPRTSEILALLTIRVLIFLSIKDPLDVRQIFLQNEVNRAGRFGFSCGFGSSYCVTMIIFFVETGAVTIRQRQQRKMPISRLCRDSEGHQRFPALVSA